MGKAKPVTLRCLLDTGASGTLIAQKHARKLRMKKLGDAKTMWNTIACLSKASSELLFRFAIAAVASIANGVLNCLVMQPREG